jgi:Putative peptidoglycan binding domain
VLVLYAGPFASPYDACAARLASPPDAFIKGTTPETSQQFVSCLCPATVTDLPAITSVGQQGVWIGELQRVLGGRLDYDVGPINADAAAGNPGQWGTYTADTAAAVGRFQAASGLNRTKQVDAVTWGALKAQAC